MVDYKVGDILQSIMHTPYVIVVEINSHTIIMMYLDNDRIGYNMARAFVDEHYTLITDMFRVEDV